VKEQGGAGPRVGEAGRAARRRLGETASPAARGSDRGWTLQGWKILAARGALAFTAWIGLLALLWGVLLVIAGLMLRSSVDTARAADAVTTGV
jgi:hypothetical protein